MKKSHRQTLVISTTALAVLGLLTACGHIPETQIQERRRFSCCEVYTVLRTTNPIAYPCNPPEANPMRDWTPANPKLQLTASRGWSHLPSDITSADTTAGAISSPPSDADLKEDAAVSLPVRSSVTDVSPLFPDISYVSYSPEAGTSVYFSEDSENPHVIIERFGRYRMFDWYYNLAYGNPVVFTAVPGEEHFLSPSWGDKILVIWLPTQKLDQPLSPLGSAEICGEEHIVTCYNFSDPQVDQVEVEGSDSTFSWLEAGYFQEDGRQIFGFGNRSSCFMEFPDLELPVQKQYPIVYEDSVHFTETKMKYRRIGVSAGEETVWLAISCNGLLFPYPDENNHPSVRFSRKQAGAPVCGSYSKPWQLRPLEPETLLDLDGDGKPEEIILHQDDWLSVSINNNVFPIKGSIREIYTASLDGGNTWQLFVLSAKEGLAAEELPDFRVFQYQDNWLSEAGKFHGSMFYRGVEEDGRTVYLSVRECYPLQHDLAYIKQEFIHGKLMEVKQDYFEFAAKFKFRPDAPASRNILLTRETIELFVEKGGTETFSLPKGSRVILLGGDLQEWILVENLDTGEQGWLHTPMQNQAALSCILADGREIDAEELFEGLRRYE